MSSPKEKIAPGFRVLLDKHMRPNLKETANVIYGLWSDFHIAYLNPGWFSFAKANGGEPSISRDWGIGRSMLECLPESLRAFYQGKLQNCLISRKVWSHEYECSTDVAYRRYHQTVYPLGDSTGLLVVNSLVIEQPHPLLEKLMGKFDPSLYTDSNGFITQCSYCRRVQNYSEADRWDWVPKYVRDPADNISHTFCPTCFGHYLQA